MQLRDEIRDTQFQARSVRQQLRQRIEMLLGRFNLAREVFCDKDGKPTPPAVTWLRQLAARNFVDQSTFHEDPREHARREGRREVALDIILSLDLDSEQVRRLRAQLHEREDSDE
ncbi:MAG TPA: hypothetical protein VFW22_16490 [Pseudolabrys sp.]|nr:hypothetical protein [Pseudolabrys sp.]